MRPMKIAILGAGKVGTTLGRGWAKKGHAVVYGVRDPSKVDAATLTNGATAATLREAVAASDVAVLTTPWSAAEDAVKAAGDFAGKPLLDVTNPLGGPGIGLVVGHTSSGGELVAGWAQGAKVVKCFNTTGMENMADPAYPDGPATMLLCGDDAGARETASALARDLGFDPIAVGGLTNARLLEPFGRLWIELALFQGQGRDVAFRLVRR